MSYNFFDGFKAKRYHVTEEFKSQGTTELNDVTLTGDFEVNGIFTIMSPGTKAYQTLNVSGVVADTQTVTIGTSTDADVYEVEQINSNTTKTTTSALTESQTNIPIQAEHGVVAGNLILVRNTEIMLVTHAAATALTVVRGWGTDAVEHTTSAEVYKGAGYTATRIPVGMAKTTLDAEPFIDHFVKVMEVAKERGMVKNDHLTAYKVSAAIVSLIADEVGEDETATTEAGTNMDWSGDTLVGGSEPKQHKVAIYNHEVTAADATLEKIYIPIEDEPDAVLIQVKEADGSAVEWDGKVVIEDDPDRLELDNAGYTDWVATNIITAIVIY